MNQLFRISTPPLSAFVAFFHYAEGMLPAQSREIVLPHGGFDLLFTLNPTGPRFAYMTGIRTGPRIISSSRSVDILSVHCRPGATQALFGIPAAEFVDTGVELERLWGPGAAHLHERLLAARSTAARFAMLEKFLTRKLLGHTRPPSLEVALTALASLPPERRITHLCDELGLRHGRFIELVRTETGMSPKYYQRLMRFRRVLARLDREIVPDWSALALDAGFHDQSHFNHEFRAFSAFSPGEYLARRTPWGHVRLA